MRAKSFFYVCAGLFLLALGYHLGARNAAAYYEGGWFRMVGPDLIAVDGRVYRFEQSSGIQFFEVPSYALPPVPASQLVWANGWTREHTVTSDGRVWWFDSIANSWQSAPIPGGATTASQESFGQLKARYRGERAAVPQGATQPQRVDRR